MSGWTKEQNECARESIKEQNRSETLAWIGKNAYSKLPLFKRVFAGNNSKVDAIKAKCLDCCGMQTEEVKGCEAYTCGLWECRPYRK